MLVPPVQEQLKVQLGFVQAAEQPTPNMLGVTREFAPDDNLLTQPLEQQHPAKLGGNNVNGISNGDRNHGHSSSRRVSSHGPPQLGGLLSPPHGAVTAERASLNASAAALRDRSANIRHVWTCHPGHGDLFHQWSLTPVVFGAEAATANHADGGATTGAASPPAAATTAQELLTPESLVQEQHLKPLPEVATSSVAFACCGTWLVEDAPQALTFQVRVSRKLQFTWRAVAGGAPAGHGRRRARQRRARPQETRLRRAALDGDVMEVGI